MPVIPFRPIHRDGLIAAARRTSMRGRCALIAAVPLLFAAASLRLASAQTPEADTLAEQHAAVVQLIASNRESADKRRDELQQEKAGWEAKLTRLAAEGLPEPRPYSYLALDKARDEVAAEAQNSKTQRDAIAVAKEVLTQATTELAERERELRKAKEALEQNGDIAREAALVKAIAEAQHAVAVAEPTAALRRAELENLQLEQQVQALRLAYAQKQQQLYKQDAVFTQVMLDEVLAELDAQIKSAAAAAKKLGNDLSKYLQPQWYQARQRLDDAKVAQDESNLATLQAEVQAKNLAQQAADYEINILVNKQERLQELKTAWQRRFELVHSTVSSADASRRVEEAKAALERLRSDAVTLNTRVDSIRKQLTALEKKRQNADEGDAKLLYWLDQAGQSLEKQRRTCEKALADLDAAGIVHQKLRDDLISGTLADAASRWLAGAWDNAWYVWEYPLLTVGDDAITVGKIVQGLFLFLVGICASRWISLAFARRFLTRMGVNASASAALQSVAFYLLVMLFTLFALKLVQVPLTAFTVLGGALALGVGFGSQNIVNNFISGLILLAERPVKVGDLIQLADLYGNVEHIGARSTRIRTGDNLDIIVPNSTFLETNVVNWTLTDNHMRTRVKFGVAYGSPTGKVTQLALKAAANHDRVFDRPAPFVIFANFGDNALEFELYFWVAVRSLMERRTIESEIRYNIDHLFGEAGIVIAFPQRDVHLFTQEPIRVQMAPPPESRQSAASDAA